MQVIDRDIGPVDVGDDHGHQEDPEILKIRKICPRFRILIIGRANSGKTTILQKMCGTTETPIVRNRDGKEIDPSILEGPTAMRGMHDIENEVSYASNPYFVFHDSRGFEAGSIEEIDNVRSFIKKRSTMSELKDRLHVIWYCVPMNLDRVLSPTEFSFFEEGTGDVPVIALFTKWDGQIVKSFGELRRAGMVKAKAKEAAPEHAMKIFETHYLPVLSNTTHPPANYVLLGYMHRPETPCSELSEKTVDAMDNLVLKNSFVSVQQTNIRLTMKYALE